MTLILGAEAKRRQDGVHPVSDGPEAKVQRNGSGSGGRLDGYLHGDIGIHLHFALGPLARCRQTRHFCTLMQRSIGQGDLDAGQGGSRSDVGRMRDEVHDAEFSVFVGVPNLVESPEGIALGVDGRDDVRLRPLHDCPHATTDVIEYLASFERPVVGLANRELNLSPLTLGVLVAMLRDYDRPHGMVERRAEIVNDVPDQQGPMDRRSVETIDDPSTNQLVLGAFVVLLQSDRVTVALTEHLQFGLEYLEMKICPSELASGARHGHGLGNLPPHE